MYICMSLVCHFVFVVQCDCAVVSVVIDTHLNAVCWWILMPQFESNQEKKTLKCHGWRIVWCPDLRKIYAHAFMCAREGVGAPDYGGRGLFVGGTTYAVSETLAP